MNSAQSTVPGARCVHRWRIEEPAGKFSQGRCGGCGAVRRFRNTHPADDGGVDAAWDSGSKRWKAGQAA